MRMKKPRYSRTVGPAARQPPHYHDPSKAGSQGGRANAGRCAVVAWTGVEYYQGKSESFPSELVARADATLEIGRGEVLDRSLVPLPAVDEGLSEATALVQGSRQLGGCVGESGEIYNRDRAIFHVHEMASGEVVPFVECGREGVVGRRALG